MCIYIYIIYSTKVAMRHSFKPMIGSPFWSVLIVLIIIYLFGLIVLVILYIYIYTYGFIEWTKTYCTHWIYCFLLSKYTMKVLKGQFHTSHCQGYVHSLPVLCWRVYRSFRLATHQGSWMVFINFNLDGRYLWNWLSTSCCFRWSEVGGEINNSKWR